MAMIVFVADHNEGDLHLSFAIARQFRQDGHNVLFTGVSDSDRVVREAGLGFFPIYESHHSTDSQFEGEKDLPVFERRAALLNLFFSTGNELDFLMGHVSPTLIVLPPYLALEGFLLSLRYRIVIGYLRNSVPTETRRALIRKACLDVLEGSPHGALTKSYLRETADTMLDLDALVENICKLPEFVVTAHESEAEFAESDANVTQLRSTGDATRLLLRIEAPPLPAMNQFR